MSNRFLWILILISFIWVSYIYYNLIYLPEKKSEIKNEQKVINSISEIKKDPELIKQVVEKKELTNLEKIEKIKQKNKNSLGTDWKYKTFILNDNLNAYFKKSDNNLNLYLSNKKIGSFSLLYPEYLRVELIYGTDNDLYIEVWDNKYYYNNNAKIVSEIKLNIDIEYVKQWLKNSLIFVTNKWSFKYFIYNKNLEYFSYFNDFIYFNEWYIWIIKKEDKRILKNLWFTLNNETIIVYYNPDSKEKKIIYNTKEDIIKIYRSNNKLYLINSDNETFELENI